MSGIKTSRITTPRVRPRTAGPEDGANSETSSSTRVSRGLPLFSDEVVHVFVEKSSRGSQMTLTASGALWSTLHSHEFACLPLYLMRWSLKYRSLFSSLPACVREFPISGLSWLRLLYSTLGSPVLSSCDPLFSEKRSVLLFDERPRTFTHT